MSNDNRQSRTMTSEEQATVSAAVAVLFALFKGSEWDTEGKGESLKEGAIVPTFVRAKNALDAFEAEKTSAVRRAAYAGVSGVLTAARDATIAGYVEVAKQIKLAPMLRTMLGDKANPPTSYDVSVSEVVPFFPKDLNEEQIVALLHEMSVDGSRIKLAPGGKGRDSKRIRQGISAEAWKVALKDA